MGVCPNTHRLTFGFNCNFARSCFYKCSAAISSTRQTTMKHLSVTTKLWLGVGSIVLGAIVIVGHAGYNSASHQKQFNEQDRLLSQRLDQAAQWSALAQVNIVRTQAALSSSDAQEAAELATQISATQQVIATLQQALQASSTGSQDQAALQQLAQLRQTMLSLTEQAQRSKTNPGAAPAELQTARSSLRQAAQAYASALQQYVQQQTQQLAQMRADMGAARQGVVRAAAIHMVFLLLGIAVGAYLLIGSIRRSMQQANQIAEHIAAGDLRAHFGADVRRDEFGQLLQSLQRMSQSLSSMIDDVRQSGDAITLASSEIASGNQDLSQRTEVTSSHLQQAAAAMVQLTQTLQATASSAQHAASLAQQACGVAQRGGTVVHHVVEAMTDIHSSSQKIADIIGVIDGIAFQTNILALNAAVEAARAGEQGRGFAVVASEVRSLAGRSAEAAKQIKELITASVAQVESGSGLVGQAGSTMQDIMQSVGQVTGLLGEISGALKEQSEGIAHVNTAVAHMDSTNQENAALVMQATQAAAALNARTQDLQQAVGAFKLDDDDAAAPMLSLHPVLAPTVLRAPASSKPALAFEEY